MHFLFALRHPDTFATAFYLLETVTTENMPLVKELAEMTSKIMQGETLDKPKQTSYTYDEIIGTVKFMVPYVGYPSVLVHEFLK